MIIILHTRFIYSLLCFNNLIYPTKIKLVLIMVSIQVKKFSSMKKQVVQPRIFELSWSANSLCINSNWINNLIALEAQKCTKYTTVLPIFKIHMMTKIGWTYHHLLKHYLIEIVKNDFFFIRWQAIFLTF